MDSDVVQAVADCDPAFLQALLERGANAEAQDSKGWSALRRTALNGCYPAAVLLLAHGASVEFGGEPNAAPLVVAAANNQIEMVKLFLAHGADINRSSTPMALHSTALTSAAVYGYENIVHLLLCHGADTEKRGYRGQTALFSWDPLVVRLLLEYGADVNAKDDDGYTALMSALHELNHEEYYEGMQETVNLLQRASNLCLAKEII